MDVDQAFRRFIWLLAWPVRQLFYVFYLLYGADRTGYGTGEATTQFTFLGAVVTTQAAAFFVAAQGSDAEQIRVPSIILLCGTIATVWGIVLFLREPQDASQGRMHPGPHFYNRGSIAFGRWTLTITLAFVIAFPLLGQLNLLPGQDRRLRFDASVLQCLPPKAPEAFSALSGHDNTKVFQTIKLLSKGFNNIDPNKQRLLIIEQDGSFQDNYHSFTAWTRFGTNTKAVGGQIFLVRGATTPAAQPRLDEVKFMPDEQAPIARQVIEIEKPNVGDYLVLLLVVEAERTPSDSEPFPQANAADYLFSLRVRR